MERQMLPRLSSRVKLIETGFQTLSDDKIFVTAEFSYAFDLSDFIQSRRQFVMTFFSPTVLVVT